MGLPHAFFLGGGLRVPPSPPPKTNPTEPPTPPQIAPPHESTLHGDGGWGGTHIRGHFRPFLWDFFVLFFGGGVSRVPPRPPRTPPCPPHLRVPAQLLEDVVDLILKAAAQHLIGLIQNEHLNELRGWRGGGAGGAPGSKVTTPSPWTPQCPPFLHGSPPNGPPPSLQCIQFPF